MLKFQYVRLQVIVEAKKRYSGQKFEAGQLAYEHFRRSTDIQLAIGGSS
jgi:hypothetical protein